MGNTFNTIKDVKDALKNNCFYVYLTVSESKFRVYDIKTVKGIIKVKTLSKSFFDTKYKSTWFNCSLNQLTQQ